MAPCWLTLLFRLRIGDKLVTYPINFDLENHVLIDLRQCVEWHGLSTMPLEQLVDVEANIICVRGTSYDQVNLGYTDKCVLKKAQDASSLQYIMENKRFKLLITYRYNTKVASIRFKVHGELSKHTGIPMSPEVYDRAAEEKETLTWCSTDGQKYEETGGCGLLHAHDHSCVLSTAQHSKTHPAESLHTFYNTVSNALRKQRDKLFHRDSDTEGMPALVQSPPIVENTKRTQSPVTPQTTPVPSVRPKSAGTRYVSNSSPHRAKQRDPMSKEHQTRKGRETDYATSYVSHTTALPATMLTLLPASSDHSSIGKSRVLTKVIDDAGGEAAIVKKSVTILGQLAREQGLIALQDLRANSANRRSSRPGNLVPASMGFDHKPKKSIADELVDATDPDNFSSVRQKNHNITTAEVDVVKRFISTRQLSHDYNHDICLRRALMDIASMSDTLLEPVTRAINNIVNPSVKPSDMLFQIHYKHIPIVSENIHVTPLEEQYVGDNVPNPTWKDSIRSAILHVCDFFKFHKMQGGIVSTAILFPDDEYDSPDLANRVLEIFKAAKDAMVDDNLLAWTFDHCEDAKLLLKWGLVCNRMLIEHNLDRFPDYNQPIEDIVSKLNST